MNHRSFTYLLAFTIISVLCLPAGADWLVKKNGDRIETQGPPWIDRSFVRYTAPDGSQQSIAASAIDFAGTIAANAPGQASGDSADAAAERADIIVYTTSWCGYCRKTLALLDELGADYLERDIEKSDGARRDHDKIARGVGVPVLDIRGRIVKGFQPDVIRAYVEELAEEES